MTLQSKLAVQIGAFVVFGVLAYVTLTTLKVGGPYYGRIMQSKDLVADILPPPEYIIEPYLVALQMAEESDSQKSADLIRRAQQLRKDYEARHQYWSILPDGPMKAQLLETSFRPAKEFFEIQDSQLIPAVQRQDRNGASRLVQGPMKLKYEEQRLAIDTLVGLANANAAAEEKDALKIADSRTWWMLGASIGIAAILLFMGISIRNGIVVPIRQAVTGLTGNSGQILAASGQVAESSQSMAEGASQSASSLEETSASLEEMSSMTKQNAENARQASLMSLQAQASAEKGREATTRMSAAIGEIKKSSDATAKILKTIDEIAFQTNLLALNAAVEAARAGDSGKGFAVVAEEVRNLAQRSAEAAKSTAALIEQARKHAENGVAVSGEVGGILREVAEAIQKVNALIGEVAAASNEQSKGVEQVNKAVSEMDKVTQSNAANAEETASASQALSSQAQELMGIVGKLVTLVEGSAAEHGHGAHAEIAQRSSEANSLAPRERIFSEA